MEENYVEDGLSLGELFRVIFRRGWLVLVITVAVTIVGALAVALIINPMQTQYSLTFSYNYPNSSSQRYPDGTSFVYRDIVSQSSLETAKASDEAFAGVDIEGTLSSTPSTHYGQRKQNVVQSATDTYASSRQDYQL